MYPEHLQWLLVFAQSQYNTGILLARMQFDNDQAIRKNNEAKELEAILCKQVA